MDRLLREKNARRLNQTEKDGLIQRLREVISNSVSPEKVILFGSILTEEFDEHSDIDVLVVFASKVEAKEGLRVLYRARSELPCSVDFICVDRDHYERFSKMGGVCYVAATEGRTLETKR